jgi:CBS domain-containing protein
MATDTRNEVVLQRLPICTVSVADAFEDEEQVLESVQCPRLQKTVRLDDCHACPYRVATKLDPTGRDSHLVCQIPAADAATLAQVQPAEDAVGQIMVKSVVCVREETTAPTLIRLFAERGISGAPVVDGDGQPLGVVSLTDLVFNSYEALEDEEDDFVRSLPRSEATAGELMTHVPITVTEDTTIPRAAEVMASHRIHRLPVVSREGFVVGLVTSLDVLTWMTQRTTRSA